MTSTVILFVIGLALICIAGDRLVDAAVAIARKMAIPQIVVGATIVSLGTTLPEILVSTTAAFGGSRRSLPEMHLALLYATPH